MPRIHPSLPLVLLALAVAGGAAPVPVTQMFGRGGIRVGSAENAQALAANPRLAAIFEAAGDRLVVRADSPVHEEKRKAVFDHELRDAVLVHELVEDGDDEVKLVRVVVAELIDHTVIVSCSCPADTGLADDCQVVSDYGGGQWIYGCSPCQHQCEIDHLSQCEGSGILAASTGLSTFSF